MKRHITQFKRMIAGCLFACLFLLPAVSSAQNTSGIIDTSIGF